MSEAFDVYGSDRYCWKVSKDALPAGTKIPYVTLFEYENLTDSVVQEMIYLKKQRDTQTNLLDNNNNSSLSTKETLADIYKGLYEVVPTNKVYRLPYMNLEGYSLSTTYNQIDTNAKNWGEKIQQIVNNVNNFGYELRDQFDSFDQLISNGKDNIQELLSKGRDRRRGAQLAKQAIKAYGSSNYGQYTTTFKLINKDDIVTANHDTFIKEILKANVPVFANISALKVPYLYQIDIPGLYFMPLGFISSFTARPIGTSFVEQDKTYFAAGWEIKMNFNSLFPISRQLIDVIDKPDHNSFTNQIAQKGNTPMYQQDDIDFNKLYEVGAANPSTPTNMTGGTP